MSTEGDHHRVVGRPPRRQSLVSVLDALVLAELAFLALLAAFAPRPVAGQGCRVLAWARGAAGGQRAAQYGRHLVRNGLPLAPEESPARAVRDLRAREYESRVETLRGYLPWRSRPKVTLTGAEHIRAGLAAGNGAVLWVVQSTGSDLAAKIALHSAGFEVTHLSRPTHGYSGSRLGVRFINPVKTRLEDRYLLARAVIGADSPTAALRQLHRALAANGVVSFTAVDHAATVTTVPFGDRRLRVAEGAPQTARGRGASLLPVFTERLRAGEFRVEVQAPIAIAAGKAGMDAALTDFAARLAAYLERNARDWSGWRNGSVAPKSGAGG